MELGRRRRAVWLILCVSGRAADGLARLPVLSGAAARGVTVDWLISPVDGMTASPRASHFTRFEAGQTEAPFAWKALRHSSKGAWPPPWRFRRTG